MDFKVDNLTKGDAEYIGEKTIGGCIARAYEKHGYILRGELRDVPKGHSCYELYKKI